MTTAAKKRTPIEYASKHDVKLTVEKKGVVVDRELDRLHKKHGAVTPDLILSAAEDPKSPLHRYFEWDDGEAAKKYRLAQAQAMLQASKMVVVLKRENNAPVAGFPQVRRLLPSARGEGKFKMRNEVLSEPDARREVIERKLGVLRGWCRETVDIEELADMRNVILSHLPEGE